VCRRLFNQFVIKEAAILMRAKILVGIFILFTAAGVVHAQNATAKVMNWINTNGFIYKSYIQYAGHPPSVQVPVPPEIDPPCHVCGDTSTSASDTQVDSWVKQNENPEMNYATELLRMAQELRNLDALDQSQLTPGAKQALAQYKPDAALGAARQLMQRLFNQKAAAMARQYNGEMKRAYAGIKYLQDVEQNAVVLDSDNAGSYQSQTTELTWQWLNAIANKIDTEVVQGKQYNLCPSYLGIFEKVAAAEGPTVDASRMQEMKDKIDKMMHFNVKLDMDLSITPGDGSQMNISWTANGKLHIKVDGQNSCYTPEMENGGKVHVNITNFNVVGKNGEVVSLVSPRSYDVQFKTPTVNLCDKQDVMLTMPFNATDFPMDTIEARGHQSKQSFFGAFLSEVATVNNVGSADTNKISGRTPNPGPAPSGSSSSPDSTTAFNLQAHKNDPGWFMSPEGQKAIADMQKQAMQTTKNAAAAKGVTLPNAGTMTDMMNAISSVRTTWSNGSSTPAQDTLSAAKDSQILTLKVSVQSQQ
jgi:hypothetical protein